MTSANDDHRSRRDRLDWRQHDRSAAARAGTLSRRGRDGGEKCDSARQTRPRTQRARRRDRRSEILQANSRMRSPVRALRRPPARMPLVEAAQRPADWVMAAITGAAGLRPTLGGGRARRDGGARQQGVSRLRGRACSCAALATQAPRCCRSDSEHNAIFQALASGSTGDVHRIILTASGGPFRTWTPKQIRNATVEQALRHPNWSMGQKITINSATMMNKGLELIEAHHLFALPSDADRRAGASAIDRAWTGRVPRRIDDRAIGVARHAGADRALPRVARTDRRGGAAARSGEGRDPDFEAPDPGRFPPCASPAQRWMRGAVRPQS